MEPKDYDNLDMRYVPLDELKDYEVAENDPDVRGWDVVDETGEKIGKVDELIVDPLALKVKYLELEMDDKYDTGAEESHILMPIGMAELDRNEDKVLLRGVSDHNLKRLPTYKGGAVTFEQDKAVRETIMHIESGKPRFSDTDMLYNEDNFFGPRREQMGKPMSNQEPYIRKRQ